MIKKNPLTVWRRLQAYEYKRTLILNQAKKRGSVIYGGQAIQKHIGIYARPTNDYDVLSNNPQRSASMITKRLNQSAKGKYYYHTPSKHHAGTHKVYEVGPDGKPRTDDDIGVADYTQMKKVKSVNLDGNRWVTLSEVAKDKNVALRDSHFSFRHEKDRGDLNAIKFYQGMKRGPSFKF